MKHIPEKDYKQLWNKTYDRAAVDKLGWYESNPLQSLQLIEKCKLEKNAKILNVGAGATTLIFPEQKN